MAARYAAGLLFAFLLIGVAVGAMVLLTTTMTGRSIRPLAFVDVWLAFGLPTVALLTVVVGPVVLALRRLAGDAFTVARGALVGAAAGPLSLLAVWFLFREGNETFAGLLQFWWRLPLEFVIGVVPCAAAGALFAGWLAAGRRPRRIEVGGGGV
jgi:hypothetical protein